MATKDYKSIKLPEDYKPSESEPYMCPNQLAYFYNILMAQKEELVHEKDDVLNAVRLGDKTQMSGVGDEQDNASLEQDITMDLRMSERDSKLLQKVNSALERLESGKFGYSVLSGEEIGLSRMLARPLATMTIEEQEEYEIRNK